eukprot:13352386-Alexandrium_andersonii.AAC.1
MFLVAGDADRSTHGTEECGTSGLHPSERGQASGRQRCLNSLWLDIRAMMTVHGMPKSVVVPMERCCNSSSSNSSSREDINQ